jgi:hypothetical protein
MKTNTIVIFTFLMFAFSCVKPPEPEDFSAAESHIISATQASTMKKEYERTISPLIKTLKSTDSNDYQPTQFAYIDFETLKNYVALLDRVNEKNQEKVSGVRIYLSSYTNQANDKNKFPGRETIFFAPTFKVAGTELSKKYSNLENLPFTIKPNGDDKYEGTFEITTELLNEYDNRSSAATLSKQAAKSNNNTTSLFLNDLQLTPPPK